MANPWVFDELDEARENFLQKVFRRKAMPEEYQGDPFSIQVYREKYLPKLEAMHNRMQAAIKSVQYKDKENRLWRAVEYIPFQPCACHVGVFEVIAINMQDPPRDVLKLYGGETRDAYEKMTLEIRQNLWPIICKVVAPYKAEAQMIHEDTEVECFDDKLDSVFGVFLKFHPKEIDKQGRFEPGLENWMFDGLGPAQEGIGNYAIAAAGGLLVMAGGIGMMAMANKAGQALGKAIADKTGAEERRKAAQVRTAIDIRHDQERSTFVVADKYAAEHPFPEKFSSEEEMHTMLIEGLRGCLHALINDPVNVEFYEKVLINQTAPQSEIYRQRNDDSALPTIKNMGDLEGVFKFSIVPSKRSGFYTVNWIDERNPNAYGCSYMAYGFLHYTSKALRKYFTQNQISRIFWENHDWQAWFTIPALPAKFINAQMKEGTEAMLGDWMFGNAAQEGIFSRKKSDPPVQTRDRTTAGLGAWHGDTKSKATYTSKYAPQLYQLHTEIANKVMEMGELRKSENPLWKMVYKVEFAHPGYFPKGITSLIIPIVGISGDDFDKTGITTSFDDAFHEAIRTIWKEISKIGTSYNGKASQIHPGCTINTHLDERNKWCRLEIEFDHPNIVIENQMPKFTPGLEGWMFEGIMPEHDSGTGLLFDT